MEPITISTSVRLPASRVWELWTDPMHIIKWNAASDDWFTPYAESDLRSGGRFCSRMEARDGSMGFDFTGTFTTTEPPHLLEYTIDDGRKVTVRFSEENGSTVVTETFEPENVHSPELQRSGWQAILDNFKKYAEKTSGQELLRFTMAINADALTVHRVMLDDASYRQWTHAFNPGSYFVGNWAKGSGIHFIGVDENGNKGGMVSRIRENMPGKFVSIEHLGVLHGDKEILEGPEVESWKGGLENYILKANGNTTELTVCMDSNKEFESYFKETWPKALARLKELCENKN